MTNNPAQNRERHVPIRTCRGCRKRFAKHELTRFVLTDENVPAEDKKKNLPGRGYYVCANPACRQAWQNRLGVRKRGSRG